MFRNRHAAPPVGSRPTTRSPTHAGRGQARREQLKSPHPRADVERMAILGVPKVARGHCMAEETWHAARLIPTSGINGAEEQERRATSALLSVFSAVREYGRAILGPLGAPAGQFEAYIEVPFDEGDRKVYPDGLIRSRRGQRTWTALVEVKTGNNELKADQLETYLDIAKEQGFDAVITISNQIPPAPGQHPTTVDRRKLRRVALHHLPWVQVLSAAVLQKEHRGVADPDQAWILGELIRYLEHPRSGAMAFEDMGAAWVRSERRCERAPFALMTRVYQTSLPASMPS
jgi:hypothetical protein